MKIDHYINNRIAAAWMLLLSLFLLPACSDEEDGPVVEPEAQYATMVISLGALDNSTPAYTRAAGENDIIDPNYADDYFERYIENWSIVVVNEDGVVDRVISDTQHANNNPNEDNDTRTDVEMELPIGETYTFYAFANLKELQTPVSIDDWDGKTFSELRETAVELQTLDQYHGGEGTSYIPMSSYGVTKTVSEDMTQNNVSLPLIRLFGKVSVEVTNSTGVDLTVNQLKMGKFRQSGLIYLLPYDAIKNDPDKPNLLLGKNEGDLMNPVFPENIEGTDWIYTPTDDKSIEYNATDENANKRTYTFYINETNQATVGENGRDLEIALDVTGEGIEKDNGRKPTNFFFVRRNDWLKIPLTISKADVSVSFEQQHMPIGGLPTQYKFQSGVEVAKRTFVTEDHAGDITISYSLTELNGSATDWKLKYYSDGNTTSADHYCYAALMSEDDNAQGYLLEPSESEKDDLLWWNVTYGTGTTKPKWAYVLHPATENKNDTTYDETEVSGSFTVTVQELSKASSATIKLNLVAEKDGVEVILPYTLVIRNKQEQGGN